MRSPTVRPAPNMPNAWLTRIRYGAGQRERFTILHCRTEQQALTRAAIMADMAKQLVAAGRSNDVTQVLERAASAASTEKLQVVRTLARRLASGAYGNLERALQPKLPPEITVCEFGTSWTDGDLHERWPDHIDQKRSAADDRWRLQKYVYPIVGHLQIAKLTLDEAEDVMATLPRPLSPASRRHVAQLLVRLCNMAVFPARLMRVSPIPRGWLPKIKKKKNYPVLLPVEDTALLANEEIPVERRLLYGFLHREGVRLGDAERLRWRQLNLAYGTLKIEVDKTEHPRLWRLDEGVAEALRRWSTLRAVEPDGLVFVDDKGKPPDAQHLAAQLRRDLKASGVTRSELFESHGNWGRFNVHTLRHSFVTRSLARGVSEDTIRLRTGHVSSELQRYREQARSLAELDVRDLTPLHEAIPELHRVGQKVGQSLGQTEKHHDVSPKSGDEKSRLLN